MAGGVDEPKHNLPKIVKEVMQLFHVDEKTANQVIAWSNTQCLERLRKWKRNLRKSKSANLLGIE